MNTVPASPIQERFWLQAQLDPSNSAYHMAFVHTVEGLLDLRALQDAFDAVVKRHEALRATFTYRQGALTVAVHDTVATPLTLHRVDPEEFDQAQSPFVTRIHRSPFDLATGPLIRAGVLSAGPDRHLLVTVVHHVAIDADAIPVLFGDLAEAYTGADMPPAPDGANLTDTSTPASRDYWRGVCAELPIHTPLPTVGAGEGDLTRAATVALPEEVAGELRRLAGAREATMFEAMAASWAAFLHRYTGEDTVAFAYPVSLAPSSLPARVGCSVNTLPMRLDVAGATFGELVDQATEARRAALPHQGVMWEQIVGDLRTTGRLAGDQPLLNVGIVATHLREVPLHLAGVEVTAQAPPQARPIWSLTLEYEVGEPTRLRLSGREDRFPAWLVEALASTLVTLVRQAVAHPDVPVQELELVDDSHRIRLTAHGQGRTPDAGATGTLAERFCEVAAAQPDAVAVQSGVDGLTYWALDIRSNRTAHALLSRLAAGQGRSEAGPSTRPGDRVGLLFERSAEAVITMVALAKLGLAYVPLRPGDPAARWTALLERTGAIAVVGQHRLLDLLPESLTLTRFAVDVPGSLAGQEDGPVPGSADPETPAYVMVTSGSTGEPKCVVVPHRAVLRLTSGGGAHQLQADDVVVHSADLAFDISTWEVWGSLLAGATLLVMSRAELLDTAKLRDKISSHGATAMVLSAPLFHAHVDTAPEVFGGLRVLIIGGDVVGPAQVARVLADGRLGALLNAYGPAENTALSTVARIDQAEPGCAVPIGRPIAGTSCHVVDDTGRLVPTGFAGELWLGGLGLALGYQDDEATAARFVEAPGHGRVYRTGDRVRWRADGQLDFLGRADAQLKIRGQHLEPTEVVAHALRHPDVRQAAVVATPGPEVALVLAYTLRLRSRLDDEGLRRHLSGFLPGFAIPDRRVRLETMPMTANGKIDETAIYSLAPDVTTREPPYTPASTETESALVALWTDLLEQEEISVLARFIDVGGDSLKAVQLVAAIRDTLDATVSVADIYRLETVRALAGALDGREAQVAPELLEPAPSVPTTERPPTVPLSLAQMAYWHLLGRGTSHGCPCLLHLQARLDTDTFHEALDDVMCRHELPWMRLDPNEPIMRRGDARACNITRMDLTRLEPEAARYQALSRMRRAAQEPFQNRSPMISIFLAQADHDSWYLGLTAPRALVDDHTLLLLVREVHDAYLARLDGVRFAPPAPMSLQAYMDWERQRVDRASVETSVTFYEGRLGGDASWTVPTSHLRDSVHGESVTLDATAVAQLQALCDDLDISLEATLTYCAFLTLHGVHGVGLVRCLSAHHNRDTPELEQLPLMMAGAMYHESHLDGAQSFRDGVSAFGRGYVEALPHARLPPLMLSGMSRLLFMRGRLAHYLSARVMAPLWSALTHTPRTVLTYTMDGAIASFFHRLERRIGRWLGRKRTRTAGCFIHVSSPLSEHALLGSTRLPIVMMRTPVDGPEATPGDPLLDLHRGPDGVQALFQARYEPAAVRAYAAAYGAVVEQVGSAPDAPLGELMTALASHAEAFERADDGV